MAESRPDDAAGQFLAAAKTHPECRGGRIVSTGPSGVTVELDLNVETPTHLRVDGKSGNGVRTTETVQAVLPPDYPWSSPKFYLRKDFPRDLPHLQPGSPDELPRPCLVDVNQREYFFQFGLVELGVFNLVHQLVLWLQRAAEGTLIHHGAGWQPTLRNDLSDYLVVNAEACRALVDRNGGYATLKAEFSRRGDDKLSAAAGTKIWLEVSQEQVPLKREDQKLFTRRPGEASSGNTVGCIVWSDKLPDGSVFVADYYLAETVNNVGRLLERADKLRCERSLRLFFENVERCFHGYNLPAPIPLGVVLCARRPCALEGSHSDIELLPYIVEIRAMPGRKSLFAAGDDEPVAPAMQIDSINPQLLRNVSGAPEIDPVAMLGCGSAGSKIALHLARSGVTVSAVSDNGFLRPHNMARHGLVRSIAAKAEALAAELKALGQDPGVYKEDLLTGLAVRDDRKAILPSGTAYAINSTASLGVREALSVLRAKDAKARIAEAALFGRGEGGFLLLEGEARNPTLCDLVAELYATAKEEHVRKLLFDPAFGLTQIQIGQGCGSMTMPMTDMRLSAMIAALTEEFVASVTAPDASGLNVLGIREEASANTVWQHYAVSKFEVVDIEGPKGWTIRISDRVLQKIAEETAHFPNVETGGVLIGLCSARLQAVTVVDLIDAPLDSQRSAARFVLGTEGLKKAIQKRHRESGETLMDVGTWHSHLADQGPSALDRATARQLASERPPPSVLLIRAPTRLYALMHTGAAS